MPRSPVTVIDRVIRERFPRSVLRGPPAGYLAARHDAAALLRTYPAVAHRLAVLRRRARQSAFVHKRTVARDAAHRAVVAENEQLRADNAALRAENDALRAAVALAKRQPAGPAPL